MKHPEKAGTPRFKEKYSNQKKRKCFIGFKHCRIETNTKEMNT